MPDLTEMMSSIDVPWIGDAVDTGQLATLGDEYELQNCATIAAASTCGVGVPRELRDLFACRLVTTLSVDGARTAPTPERGYAWPENVNRPRDVNGPTIKTDSTGVWHRPSR